MPACSDFLQRRLQRTRIETLDLAVASGNRVRPAVKHPYRFRHCLPQKRIWTALILESTFAFDKFSVWQIYRQSL
jgi:hypothetical protein